MTEARGTFGAQRLTLFDSGDLGHNGWVLQAVRMSGLSLDDLRHPIVQAPMAGGPSTPALAAAVSGAGGLGFLAAGYKTVDQVERELAEVGSLLPAGVSYGLNLFASPGHGNGCGRDQLLWRPAA